MAKQKNPFNHLERMTKKAIQKEVDRLQNFFVYDAKYSGKVTALVPYLTPYAEWKKCAEVQLALLSVREGISFEELKKTWLEKFSPVNMNFLEDRTTQHDQLAVIKEMGVQMGTELEALLHPGTTSYDILDTARSILFRDAWIDVIRPQAVEVLGKLISLSERTKDKLSAGRTHLQLTAPVLYGRRFSRIAAAIADRIELIDFFAKRLKGTFTGITGTGAGLDMVIGHTHGHLEFEKEVLALFDLEPDYLATQIIHKNYLIDFAHGLATLGMNLAGFADDVRLLYASGLGELTSRDNQDRLGGSSSDATKNNPINYENMAATQTTMKSGMLVLYDIMNSNLERDLRDSKLSRMEPQTMMVALFETLVRMSKALDKLNFNDDAIAANLQKVRAKPGDAMTTILRGVVRFDHPEFGIAHNFVKNIGIKAQMEGRKLLEVALDDAYFKLVYDELSDTKRRILGGEMELYLGSETQLIELNLIAARKISNVA